MTTDSDGEPIEVNVSEEPPGLERARAASNLLDEAVELPVVNYKVGLDPMLGLMPVSGDAASAALSLYVVAEGARMGASTGTIARMLANVGIDFAGGVVPIAGTVFDAVWKANERNVNLLEEEFGAE
ncbi:DUF4112 domain-containing protein [Halorussus halophilus]|uniref:DUF4112 domain-containing protein n=1 Tax=Halorussus halophilus TaxID=2650975 RepID=UPI00130128D9|nr:DUF4112 domain-containing protein [Halorussus halophilus]